MNADVIMGLLFETMAAQGKRLLSEDDQKLLERVLQQGSGYEGGKVRISVAVKKWGQDPDRLKKFVSEEYGVGGNSGENDTFVDYNGKGIKVTFWKKEREPVLFTWDRIARTLVEMESRSVLFDLQTMQKVYAIWQQSANQGRSYPDPMPRMHYPPEVMEE